VLPLKEEQCPIQAETGCGFTVLLQVPRGHTMALVGPSGCGKSSVLALILRFYDVAAGRVLVDGRDVREYRLRALRSRIGLVSQEPALFATR